MRTGIDADAGGSAGAGKWIAATVSGGVALAAYAATLAPTVVGGDSGELCAAAHVWGVVHPPGYPLYTLLAGLFAHLPLGSAAARVNLFSAVCDAAAAVLLCRAAARWAGDAWAGVLAALAFALSPIVWPYAVTAEVFPLNNLFAALLLDLSVTAVRRASRGAPSLRLLAAAGACLGLGLANHHTIVFLGLPLCALLAFLYRREPHRGRAAAVLAGGIAAGLLPYLYLPIAAARSPPIAWGDTASLSGFLTHVLRREYGTFQLASTASGFAASTLSPLLLFAGRFGRTTYLVGPLLALAVLPALRRREPDRALAITWVCALVFYLIVFASLANLRVGDPVHVAVLDRFWQQAVLIASALGAVGLKEIARRLPPRAARALPPIVALALPAAMAAANLRGADQSRNTFFRDWGAGVLDSLPPRAILLVSSDESVGSVRYLQEVEGRRPDVRVIPTGHLLSPWFGRFASRHLPDVVLPAAPGPLSARAFMDANVPRTGVFVLNRIPWLQTLEETHRPWQMGLVEQILPRDRAPQPEDWISRATASFSRFDPAAARRPGAGVWERYVADIVGKQMDRFARQFVDVARGHGTDADVARLVIRALGPIAERHPSPEPNVWKNLGVAHQVLARTDPAERAQMARCWRKYLLTDPTGDPDYANIRRMVDAAPAP